MPNVVGGEATGTAGVAAAAAGRHSLIVYDMIFTPNDTISVQKRTNVMWAAIRGAHRIPKKK